MIALIFCGDLKYCPYIKRYIERIEKQGLEYSVVFWNRCGQEQNLPENYYYYNSPSDLKKGKIKKLLDFFYLTFFIILFLSDFLSYFL